MPLPQLPKSTSLDNSCTVIHEGTLYSYSPEGFIALPLEENAKWQTLDGGVKVDGPICIGTSPPDASKAAFVVVGGKARDGAYAGIQQYNFAARKWTTIESNDMKGRQGHGAAYLKDINAIVTLSGTTGGRGASMQSFLITLDPPSVAGNIPLQDIKPVISPNLLPWTSGDVSMIGGTEMAGKVYFFNKNTQWRPSPMSLAQSYPSDSAAIRSVLIHSDDGAQDLYTFDLGRSPNRVTKTRLQDTKGPVANAQPEEITFNSGGKTTPKSKRGLNLDGAPKATRTNFAVAVGSNGTVVFSGGNQEEPIAMFNARENTWLNPAAVFLSDGEQKVLSFSSTSSAITSTSTPISTSTTLATVASTTAPPATTTTSAAVPTGIVVGGEESHNTGPSSNAILGVTLGSIAAFLALLCLILFLLRRHKKKRQTHVEDDNMNPDEKDTVAFAKSTQPSASPAYYRGHNPQLSTESYSSVAILMGRMGPNKSSGVTRNPSRNSVRSEVSSLHKQFKSTIGKPIPQSASNPILQGHDDKGVAFAPSVAEPRPRNGPIAGSDGTRRSSGWNKYWSGGSALQILGYGGGGKRTTATSEQSSHYSEAVSTNNQRATQDSATVPPLNFEERTGMSRVISGSPIISQYNGKMPFTEGITGTIERPISPVSTISGYSSGVPESVNEIWDPSGVDKPWGNNRAPSSSYAPSEQYSTPLAPSQGAAGAAGAAPVALGVSKQPQLAMASTSSDMSWLNLGDQSRP